MFSRIRRTGFSIPALLCVLASSLWGDQFGDFTYVDNGTTITITGYPVTAVDEVVIPAFIMGKPVTAIGSTAFAFCSGITSVVIPNGVSTLDYAAFIGCSSLTSLTIPPSVLIIGDLAFQQCSGLTNVTIPASVTTIGITAFAGCVSLESITLPSSVTSIGRYAFQACHALESIILPDSITAIEDGTFNSCFSLTSITIPATVTNIGKEAFRNCENLKNITLPASITTIGDGTFRSCTSLTSITIPATVSNIGKEAFHRCENLKNITLPASIAAIEDEAFSTCSSLTSACFLGDAPTMGYSVFYNSAVNFAVYYFNGATGFSSPTWEGYSSINMGAPSPVAPWLLGNSFAYNESLQADPNGDGVNLLMAYALNMNPHKNLCHSLPQPVFDGNQLSLNFYGASDGVSYVVQASDDLKHWSTNNVIVSPPDTSGNRSASVPAVGLRRFMRLLVRY